MRVAALVLMSVLYAPHAPAVGGLDARFISDAPTPLKQAAFIASEGETRFSGSVAVTGTFEISWEPESEGFGGGYRVVFKPDAGSRQRLPHDAGRGPVNELWIRNTYQAIGMLISPAQKKSIRTSGRWYTGTASMTLTSYRTGVDCDHRGYNAVLVSLKGAVSGLASVTPSDEVPMC